MGTECEKIVDLNIGGVLYTTSIETLQKDHESLLCSMFSGDLKSLVRDSKGRIFLDRDGVLFRYILDFLRSGKLVLPADFQEVERLKSEAEFYKMERLSVCLNNYHSAQTRVSCLTPVQPHQKRPSATDMSGAKGAEGYIIVGYRGTFAFGRDMSDVKFRKLSRILVHGKVMLCKEVFKDTLNESRDPDRGLDGDRYTSRFFLKHTALEQAFDQLCEAGFTLVGSCGSGTAAPTAQQDLKPGQTQIEDQWNHYNEFIFVRSAASSYWGYSASNSLQSNQEFF